MSGDSLIYGAVLATMGDVFKHSLPIFLVLLALNEAQAAPPSGQESELRALLAPRLDEAGQRLRRGVEALNAGKAAAAKDMLTDAIPELQELGDYGRLYAARAAIATGQANEAIVLLEGRSGNTAIEGQVPALLGRALSIAGRHEEAVRSLRGYLEAHPNGRQVVRVRRALLDSLESLGRRREAATEKRKIWAQLPVRMPRQRRPPKASHKEVLERAEALYQHHRHKEVLALLKTLRKKKLSSSERCQAIFLDGHTRFKMRTHSAAARSLANFIRRNCQEPRVRALYLLARARARSGDKRGAKRSFDQLVREFPDSSYADDAMLLKAEVLMDEKKRKQSLALLRKQVKRYPQGDMATEARWRLAWIPYLRGQLKTALKALNTAQREGAREDSYDTRGRSLYWKGRILQRLGRSKQAVKSWRRCIQEHPLSYYAFQALNRLQEAGISPGVGLLPLPSGPRDWKLPKQVQLESPGFKRSLRLLRLGLHTQARGELRALGLLEADAPEGLWLAAQLFEASQLFHHSHNIPRRLLPSYQDRMPSGEAYKEWLIAHPRPFRAAMRSAIEEGGVPEHLMLGLVREESGFNPRIESWANAIGLSQLLLTTAQDVARKLPGVTATPQTLRDPKINLRIGAHFLGGLLRRFKHPALAVAGYNAGGGAVSRWLKASPRLAIDELVEAIPYDQTRGYTKRVVQSWGRYHFLYAKGALIKLPRRRSH